MPENLQQIEYITTWEEPDNTRGDWEVYEEEAFTKREALHNFKALRSAQNTRNVKIYKLTHDPELQREFEEAS